LAKEKGIFMMNRRKFNIVLVNGKNAIGSEGAAEFNRSVIYNGKQAVVSL
jgi:hypothetical protein